MTTFPKGKNLMNGNDKKRDDLTKIRGIGPVKQQWLRELLNIDTFQDLANLSIDEVESCLRTQGHTVSRSDIERWIVQSKELTAIEQCSQQFLKSSDIEIEQCLNLSIQESELSCQVMVLADTEAEKLSNLQGEESESSQLAMASVNAGAEENLLTKQDEWRTFASFRVEFQTRRIEGQGEEQRTLVHYVEANKFQTWSDMESDRLQAWMLDQISEDMWQSIEAETPVTIPSVKLEINQIGVFQPPHTERPMVVAKGNRLFSSTLRSDKSFAIDVGFNLTGLTARHITNKQVAYYAQFSARNRLTGEIIHLGDTEPVPLVKGQLSYTAVLAEIMLEPGVYRLQAIVKLQGVPAALGSFKVPLLQVV